MQGDCGDFGEQRLALDVAMGAEAGGDAVEVAVVVAGMAAEFEGALGGHGVKNLVEGFGVEVAGGGDADGSVGGEDVRVADLGLVFEAGFEAAEEFDLETANAVAVAESEAPGLLEWVTNGADGAAFGDAQQRAGDGREEVGVLVGVDVGDVDAGALELLDLGEGFALDVVFADGAAEESLNEVDERGAKVLAVGAEERGDAFGGETGVPSVRTMWQPTPRVGMGVGDGDGVVERGAGGHQGGGGEGAGLVKFCDGAIDARSEAEVVRVDDESGRHRHFTVGRSSSLSKWMSVCNTSSAGKTMR